MQRRCNQTQEYQPYMIVATLLPEWLNQSFAWPLSKMFLLHVDSTTQKESWTSAGSRTVWSASCIKYNLKHKHICAMAVRILNTGLVWIQNWFGLSNTDAFGEQGRAAKNQFSAVPPNSAVSMDVEFSFIKASSWCYRRFESNEEDIKLRWWYSHPSWWWNCS